MQPAKVFDSVCRDISKIEHLTSIADKDLSGKGKRTVLRRTVEKRFADLGLEATDRLADGRLCSSKQFGSAGKALFAGNSDQYFKLIHVHFSLLGVRQPTTRRNQRLYGNKTREKG